MGEKQQFHYYTIGLTGIYCWVFMGVIDQNVMIKHIFRQWVFITFSSEERIQKNWSASILQLSLFKLVNLKMEQFSNLSLWV